MIDFGSPPCSPQIPTSSPGRVARPLSTAIFIKPATASSSVWNGLTGRILSSTYLSRKPPSASSRREAERHLGEVVRAEAEELGVAGDLVGGERAAWNLDHRPELVVDLHAGLGLDGLRFGLEQRLGRRQLVDVPDERDQQ